VFVNKKSLLLLNYLLHILNGIVPFILIIILTRKYDLDFLGKYYYCFSIISIVQLFIDYSFSFSALREYKNIQSLEHQILNDKINLFLNIILSKVFISISLFSLLLIYVSVFHLENYIEIFYLFFLGVILSITNFNWFFYATDNSLKFSFLQLILRLIFLNLFFLKLTFFNVLFVTFLPIIFSNLFLIFFIKIKNGASFKLRNFKLEVKRKIWDGRNIFLNSILISVFISSWPIILRINLNNYQLGLYGIADKILKGLLSLITPLPNFILSSSRNNNFIINRRKFLFLIILIVPIIFILIPNELLNFVIGKLVDGNRRLFNLYSLGFISGAINLITYTILIYYKREIEYLRCFFLTVIINIFLFLFFDITIFTPLYFDLLLAFFMVINFYKNNLSANFLNYK